MPSNKVHTRFAPSPTGYMHVGNLRTALYTYLMAKHEDGTFILRIEDTDQGRYVEGAVDVIYNTLRETGLLWDEGPDIGGPVGPYVQSERMGMFKQYAEQLVAEGKAYYCFCTEERLEALRQEIAEVQEKLNVQKAGWLNQKNAIDHVQELKGQLDEAKSEEERATRNGDLGRASELRYSVIPGLQQQIQDSEAALEAQKQQDGEGLNEQVTSDEIAEVVSAWTGVPVSKMMQGELDKLKGLEGELHKRVIGQDEAVSAVAAAVRRSRAGLSDPDKPIGSFFFLGPTGVGKTELAKALAECLFDDERALVRIDMSEYMEKFSVQRLIGAPPGYVGYDEGGQLTEAVRRRPYSVILLDEMEKAHPDVFNVLLQVLDDGRLTDGQGRQVSFKNTIIIMTSNVGSKAIAELSGKDEEEMRHQVDAAMAQTFRPEFLNRIDDIVVFHPLGMAQIEKIVDIQLADVRARLAKERMTLAITPAAKQLLAVGGLDPVFGARPLKRLVQREVVDAIAAAIIDGTVREGDQVTVDVDKDGGFTVVCDNTPAATYEVPDAE